MDDHRVGVADIEAAFHDVGREQHVELALDELLHGVFDLRRRQAAVRHGQADFRHQLAQLGRHGREVFDARADVEALAAAELLAQQCLADRHAIERSHEGADG